MSQPTQQISIKTSILGEMIAQALKIPFDSPNTIKSRMLIDVASELLSSMRPISDSPSASANEKIAKANAFLENLKIRLANLI